MLATLTTAEIAAGLAVPRAPPRARVACRAEGNGASRGLRSDPSLKSSEIDNKASVLASTNGASSDDERFLDLDSWLARESLSAGWTPYGQRGRQVYQRNPLDAYRPYRRTEFTLEDWESHRSLSRYVRNMVNLPQSGIFRALAPPITFLTVETVALIGYADAVAQGLLPTYMPQMPNFGLAPFELTAFALALLLGFRTNISYSRWASARQIWSDIIASSRSLGRLCMVYMTDDASAVRAATWTKAFLVSLQCRLREDSHMEAPLEQAGLPSGEAARVAGVHHSAVYCMQELSAVVLSAPFRDNQVRGLVEAALMDIDKQMSGCETLIRSPMPLFYTQHVSRFMTVWLGLLPLGLVTLLGWQAVPAMAAISFALLGIDEIGLQIEEPFGVLPLESMVRTASADMDLLVRARADRAQP